MRPITCRAALTTIGAGLGPGAAACGGFGSTRPVPDDALPLTHRAASAERPAFAAPAEGLTAETGIPVELQGRDSTDSPTLMAAALLSSLPVLFAVARCSFVTGPARTGLR